jgi:hypothetical protein
VVTAGEKRQRIGAIQDARAFQKTVSTTRQRLGLRRPSAALLKRAENLLMQQTMNKADSTVSHARDYIPLVPWADSV